MWWPSLPNFPMNYCVARAVEWAPFVCVGRPRGHKMWASVWTPSVADWTRIKKPPQPWETSMQSRLAPAKHQKTNGRSKEENFFSLLASPPFSFGSLFPFRSDSWTCQSPFFFFLSFEDWTCKTRKSGGTNLWKTNFFLIINYYFFVI